MNTCVDTYLCCYLWLLANIISVLTVTNAPCEGGFSHMSLTKGRLQGSMGTDTLDSRLFVKLHGPPIDDDDAASALCLRVAKTFWEKHKVPGWRGLLRGH